MNPRGKAAPKKAAPKTRKKNTKTQPYFDRKAADRVVKFIETFCTHVNGDFQGQPIKVLPYWKQFIHETFGWKKPNGKRKIRESYCEIARKNAKSTIIAGIGLYMLCADGEAGGEVYVAAGDREQARILFDIAKQMIDQSPRLSKVLKCYKNVILHEASNSIFKVLSAESYTKHGFNASCVIMDELHVQPNRKLFDVLATSTGARSQPLVISITTAGIKNTFAEAKHDYAVKHINGTIKDPSFYGKIYAAHPDDDPFAVKTWRKANPGYGITVTREYFEQQATKAKNEPSFFNTFLQLHLGIWVGNFEAWIPEKEYMKCDLGAVSLDDLADRQAYGGLDLASVRDLSSLSLYYPPIREGKKLVQPGVIYKWYWCPEDTIYQRSQKENIHFEEWVKEDYIIATPGNVQDYAYLKSDILHICEQHDVHSIAFDRWNSSQLVIELLEEGVDMEQMGQGFGSMSTPTKTLEKLIMKREVNHQGNPVSRWQYQNVVLEKNPTGDIKPNKKRSKDKIDGVVSDVMAVGRHLTATANDTKTTSRYEDEDSEVISVGT